MILTLPYGCTRGLPDNVKVAWGTRMIWPDDILWDRQGCAGGEDGCEERNLLLAWLGGGAGDAMRAEASRLANGYELSPGSEDVVTLYEDAVGRIVGSPQGSHGYFYVAAWRHADDPDVCCKFCSAHHARVPADLCVSARLEYNAATHLLEDLEAPCPN